MTLTFITTSDYNRHWENSAHIITRFETIFVYHNNNVDRWDKVQKIYNVVQIKGKHYCTTKSVKVNRDITVPST